MNFASGLYDTEYTGSLWPAKDIVQLPVSVSHMRTIPSKEALKITETNVKHVKNNNHSPDDGFSRNVRHCVANYTQNVVQLY